MTPVHSASRENYYMSSFTPPGQPLDIDKGIIESAAKWEVGSVITVSFLGPKPPHGPRPALPPDDARCEAVLTHAREWLTTTKAKLRFEPKPDGGLVRVAFDYSLSWSAIGTWCLRWDPSEPTMNFAFLEFRDPVAQRGLILHEFGHALGLHHEHQSPAAGYEWNREVVIQDAKRDGWTAAQVEDNIFRPAKAAETQFTAFDPASIMIYPIPQTWLTKGQPVAENFDLSVTDIEFVAKQYGG